MTEPAPGPVGPQGYAAERLVCATCGRVPVTSTERDLALLTWTTGAEGGRVVRSCDACSREHIRAIEAKLDSADW